MEKPLYLWGTIPHSLLSKGTIDTDGGPVETSGEYLIELPGGHYLYVDAWDLGRLIFGEER